MRIAFKDLKAPISFDGAETLVPVLKCVLCGWTLREIAPDQGTPRIRLTVGPRGFERRSPWIAGGDVRVFMDPVDAVCDLLLDIERAYIEDSPSLLALHAAGVEIGGGVVVFLSSHATGKSVLTVALAQAGCRVFADDQLPIVPGPPTVAVAPGFLPRLRRPLPDTLEPELEDFIRTHEGPMSARFRYVKLAPKRLAPLGVRAPIIGVVLVDRRPGADVEIVGVSEAEVLKACVLQSFGRTLGALEGLDHLHDMVKGATCVRLTYGEASDAPVLLQETFT